MKHDYTSKITLLRSVFDEGVMSEEKKTVTVTLELEPHIVEFQGRTAKANGMTLEELLSQIITDHSPPPSRQMTPEEIRASLNTGIKGYLGNLKD